MKNQNEEVAVKTVIASLQKKAKRTMDAVSNLLIKTQDDYNIAGEMIATLKAMSKEAAKEKATIIDPMKQAVKAAEAHFKPFIEAVSALEIDTKKKMLEFVSAQQKKIEAVQKKFDDGEIKKVSTVVDKINALEIKSDVVSVRKIWTATIVDEAKIPRVFLLPDMVKIREACKNGNTPAGVVWEQKDTIAI